MGPKTKRFDLQLITDLIEINSTVLDLGCGSGDLLQMLSREKKVRGQGIERKESEIYKCVEKGLSVFHMDFDSGLSSFSDSSFDYVILNQSLSESLQIEYVLEESLRVGKKVVIGFSNFAYIRARMQLFFKGTAPVFSSLPHLWFDTPNVHFLSILDFKQYLNQKNITLLKQYYFSGCQRVRLFPNLLAKKALLVIYRKS